MCPRRAQEDSVGEAPPTGLSLHHSAGLHPADDLGDHCCDGDRASAEDRDCAARIVALIVASVVPFGLLLHFTWWRTATKVSHDLVDTLERQVTNSVRRTWWGRVLEVQGLSQVVSEAAAVPGGPLNVERVLVASAASVARVVLGTAHTERGRGSGSAGARAAPHARSKARRC